ncbi:MAG: 7-cyano-7-deazaguanine synthase [Pseudonocardia sp.]|nr:7-cyano-7-deazaguanine synthase [Pseudonocardia sp.]
MFLVDKRYRRTDTADRWTRTIELSVQVLEPDTWTDQACRELDALLGMMTGDRWSISVHRGAQRDPQQRIPFDERAAQVALFSGGLDSTCYAAQVGNDAAGPLLLIAYDDWIKTRQRDICDAIQRRARRPLNLRQGAQRPRTKGSGLEQSSRSRGFLYMATAVCAAAAHHLTEVAVPENGQLAINPPLTASRLGALSTRSVHPWSIDRLNRVIAAVGGDVTVTNPLLSLTKGEVCELAINADLTPADLEHTVSCGNPRAARRNGGPYHCGHCYPCLIRRSGLLRALGSDPTTYRLDPARIDPDDSRTEHLRALLQWTSTDFTIRDLIADTPFPDTELPAKVLPTIQRGRRELAAMIDQLLPAGSPLRGTWQPHVLGVGA